jgi:hypothetical protein
MEEYTFQVLNTEYKIKATSVNQALELMNNIMPTLNVGPHKWFGGINGTKTWRAGLSEHTGSMYD